MEIRTTIGWNKAWLRRVIHFCCRELEYSPTNLNTAFFSLAHNCHYKGRAYYRKHIIRVQINPLIEYPIKTCHPRSLPELLHTDSIDLLVRITAHELAHLSRWDHYAYAWPLGGPRDTNLERDTDTLARGVLAAFRGKREELLDKWGDPGPGPVPPSTLHQLTCAKCSRVWRQARRPRNPQRVSCGQCFRTWDEAARHGEFLIYECVCRGA